MTQTKAKPSNLQELVVFHLVPLHFKWDNIYALGGARPNAQYIAAQYGCQLEFRESQFRETGIDNFTPSYLERYGIGIDGSCTSAVLKGKDRRQLAKARDDIHRTFGVSRFDGGAVDVSSEKSYNK